MAEAVREEAAKLDVAEEVRSRLLALSASTVHRLLGRHPASANRFRHNRENQLPHDVVIVDETSMMSLPLMARLVEAVRSGARLVLLGDQEQLASVEAGAVLGDIVGPAAAATRPGDLGPCITVLKTNHRFRGALADLANAVRAGDEPAVLSALSVSALSGAPGGLQPGYQPGPSVRWLPVDVTSADDAALGPVRASAARLGRALAEAAREGDGPGALEALSRFRLLCAHRSGPAGAITWNAHLEQWLAGETGASEGAWYLGRPVIVTENDYSLGLFNGDTGVVIARPDGGLTVAFRRGADLVTVSPSRLGAAQTAFAMTAHRAQGSEFDEVVVLLPAPSSRILTRELLYTAVTRARRSVLVVGSEGSVRAAVRRPVGRASGLTARLWSGYGS
jgi:exodeoxyribonuclease V alpha subunit